MVEAGQMLWHDAVRPVLPDGTYRVTMTPQLAFGTSPAPGELDVAVAGPPPDPATVRSVPAAGATDVDPDVVPFVLLERRTLPWERDGLARPGTPWLALVLTTEAEAALRADGGAAGVPQGPAGVLTCTDVATQTRVVPTPAEVPLLAHVREHPGVAGDDDGWQAVVVANRVPRAAGAWRVTLVALDGRADLAGAAPRLGLTALWSGTFTVGAAGAGTSGTLAAIRPGLFADPARLGATRGDGPLVDDSGAVAVQAFDLSGAVRTGRLRSPLRADAAPGGDDDLTELAAETLGRLMAFADARLLADVTAWYRARQHARTRAGAEPVAELVPPAAPRTPVAGAPARPAAPGGPGVAVAPAALGEAVALAATRRWQGLRLPVAGALGSAAAPVRPDPLRRLDDGSWA